MIKKKNKQKPHIDIVPLIDVLIVLIFFFIITMNFQSRMVAEIIPPELKSAGHVNTKDDIVIAIDQKGEIFFNNSIVSSIELEQVIQKTAKLNNTQSVLIIADENSELKYITHVLDCCKRNNLYKLRLQAR